MDVPGAHVAHGCHAVALISYGKRGLSGLIKIFQLASPAGLRYERDIELQYMRQYAGLRQDVDLPELNHGRLIHTGSNGDLSEVIFAHGKKLVMVWLSAVRTLQPPDIRYVLWVAHKTNSVLGR